MYNSSTLLDQRNVSDTEDQYKREMLAMMGAAKYRKFTGDQVCRATYHSLFRAQLSHPDGQKIYLTPSHTDHAGYSLQFPK